jgi:HD-GYP domain-containing protein (c-di-GMP phosphodiesterase class II)
MNALDFEKVTDIGISLSKEKDHRRVLETIIDAAMDITNCDAGTLYTVKEDKLHFTIMVTKSVGIKRGMDGEPINLPPIGIDAPHNICAMAARSRELIMADDVYDSKNTFDFSGPKSYDAMTGFHSKSVLALPMVDNHDEVAGVIQLWNALDADGGIIPFDRYSARVALSLATQAAICLTNINYEQELRELMNSFIKTMTITMESRTPYNAYHTTNMTGYAERFLKWMEASDSQWKLDKEHERNLLMAIWLHDVGKLVIPLEVMDKGTRLGDDFEKLLKRLEADKMAAEIKYLRGGSGEAEYEKSIGELDGAIAAVTRMNMPGFLADDMIAELDEIFKKGMITTEEYVQLSVRKGTLTDKERETMQSHAEMTDKILSQMRFNKAHKDVPLWAAMHHEFLNGGGYPKKLSERDIPREVRLITIIDIYDALTSSRSYKNSMPPERAFEILGEMARDNQIDASILDMFKASGAWETGALSRADAE